MNETFRKWMDTVEKTAAEDPKYRQMLLDMRAIEKRYNEVLATLARDDQNAICDFVSQCEEMSWRMLELACTIKESPSV
jgi:hypothetical protein